MKNRLEDLYTLSKPDDLYTEGQTLEVPKTVNISKVNEALPSSELKQKAIEELTKRSKDIYQEAQNKHRQWLKEDDVKKMKEFSETFGIYPTVGDGGITKEEFYVALERFGNDKDKVTMLRDLVKPRQNNNPDQSAQ